MRYGVANVGRISVHAGKRTSNWLILFLILEAIFSGRSSGQTAGGVPQDLARKANSGDAQAMDELGLDCQRGKGVGLDLAAGQQWLEKAAEAGSTPAMDRL